MPDIDDEPNPVPVDPPAAGVSIAPARGKTIQFIGAGFALLTFAALFALGALLMFNSQGPIACTPYWFVYMAFTIGAAMTAAFLGGGAALQGNLGMGQGINPLKVSAGGGVAVLLILLVFGWFMRPPTCVAQDQADLILKLRDVPVELEPLPNEKLWIRTSENRPGNDQTLRRDIAVRMQPSESTVLHFIKDGQLACELSLTFDRQHPLEMSEEKFRIRGFSATHGIVFTFDKLGDDAAKRCFSHKNETIEYIAHVSLQDHRFAFCRFDCDLFAVGPSPVLHGPQYQAPSPGFQLISPAYAGTEDFKFAQLRELLNSTDAKARIEARSFLGRSFETYQVAALQDLRQDGHSAEYYSSLLHGLIAAVELHTPKLKPASGRDLSASTLPYMTMADMKRVVDLTNHPDDLVARQARRLMQRYPIQGFEALLASSIQPDSVCNAAGGAIYASIFYQYNRLIQQGLDGSIKDGDVAFWDAKTQQVKAAAARCLNKDDYIDAALLDYGRARSYDWSSVPRANVVSAAQAFLSHIGDNADLYYRSSHIKKMASLATG